jgi:hypothetical protein
VLVTPPWVACVLLEERMNPPQFSSDNGKHVCSFDCS